MVAGPAGSRAPRFHGCKGGDGAAQEPAFFGLPPRVDYSRSALPHHVVIPPPYRRLDGLAHRGHMLEPVVIFRWLVVPGTPQRADRRRRSMENIYVEFFGNAPRAPGIRKSRKPLIYDTGGSERQRPVHDVGMTGDPTDIGHTPVNVLGMDVLNIFRGTSHISEISSRAVLTAFRFAGGTTRVH